MNLFKWIEIITLMQQFWVGWLMADMQPMGLCTLMVGVLIQMYSQRQGGVWPLYHVRCHRLAPHVIPDAVWSFEQLSFDIWSHCYKQSTNLQVRNIYMNVSVPQRLEQCFPYIFWNSVCRFAPSIHMDHSQKFGYYTAGCPKGCCCCLYNCWILVDTTHRQYRISMRARQLQPTGIFKTCKFIWNLSLHNATTCP